MSRELIMETLAVLPEDFKMEDFIIALYERVSAVQGVIDAESGNEIPIEDMIKEFNSESKYN